MLLVTSMQATCTRSVYVSTFGQLNTAIQNIQSGDCIYLNPGVYHVTENSPLKITGVNNIVLSSATGNPGSVTITGVGFCDDGSAGACSPHQGEQNNDCLWIGCCSGSCNSITITGITFTEDCYGIKVTPPTNDIEILNCRFINFGYRCIKGVASGTNIFETNGLVQNCYFEDNKIPSSCWNSGGDYIAGMDMMWDNGWTIEDNTFVNIKGYGGGARAAVFLWVGCKNCIVQRNRMIGCDRGVAFGNASGSLNGQNQIARNNYIVAPADDAIELESVDSCGVYNNSCYLLDTSIRGIYCVVDNPHVTNTNIQNNMLNNLTSNPAWTIQTTGLTSGTVNNNDKTAPLYDWVDPTNGNLDLTSFASDAISQGINLAAVTQDIYQQPRPNPPCIGADEYIPPLRPRLLPLLRPRPLARPLPLHRPLRSP